MYFENLPTEIVTKIFDYCYTMDYKFNKTDFKMLRLVCKRWFEIIHKFYHQDFVIGVQYEENSLQNLYTLYRNSFRYFYDIQIYGSTTRSTRIRQIDLNKDLLIKFFKLPNIKILSLEMLHFNLSVESFSEILTPLENLKKLTVSDAIILNEPVQLEGTVEFQGIISQLKYFKLYSAYWGCSNINSILKIVSYTKNLEHFEIQHDGCCGRGIPYANVLFTVLKNNSSTLRALKINPGDIIENIIDEDETVLNSLQSLNIKKLQIIGIKNLSILIPFLSMNCNIVDLNLDLYFTKEEEIDFHIIQKSLKNLKCLRLSEGKFINLNLITLSKVEKLIELDLCGCHIDFITDDDKSPKIYNLKYLEIGYSTCSNRNLFIDIALNIPNLEVLTISDDKLFDDVAMQIVIQNLTKLKKLCLLDCNLYVRHEPGFNYSRKRQIGHYKVEDLRALRELLIDNKLDECIDQYRRILQYW